jgi:ubiquitin C-terminal hydrolase
METGAKIKYDDIKENVDKYIDKIFDLIVEKNLGVKEIEEFKFDILKRVIDFEEKMKTEKGKIKRELFFYDKYIFIIFQKKFYWNTINMIKEKKKKMKGVVKTFDTFDVAKLLSALQKKDDIDEQSEIYIFKAKSKINKEAIETRLKIYKSVGWKKKLKDEGVNAFVMWMTFKDKFIQLNKEYVIIGREDIELIFDLSFIDTDKELKKVKKRWETLINSYENITSSIIQMSDPTYKNHEKDIVSTYDKNMKNLINDKSNCFMNSLLQCIIRSGFINGAFSDNPITQKILDSIKSVKVLMNNKNKKRIYAGEFYNLIWDYKDILAEKIELGETLFKKGVTDRPSSVLKIILEDLDKKTANDISISVKPDKGLLKPVSFLNLESEKSIDNLIDKFKHSKNKNIRGYSKYVIIQINVPSKEETYLSEKGKLWNKKREEEKTLKFVSDIAIGDNKKKATINLKKHQKQLGVHLNEYETFGTRLSYELYAINISVPGHCYAYVKISGIWYKFDDIRRVILTFSFDDIKKRHRDSEMILFYQKSDKKWWGEEKKKIEEEEEGEIRFEKKKWWEEEKDDIFKFNFEKLKFNVSERTLNTIKGYIETKKIKELQWIVNKIYGIMEEKCLQSYPQIYKDQPYRKIFILLQNLGIFKKVPVKFIEVSDILKKGIKMYIKESKLLSIKEIEWLLKQDPEPSLKQTFVNL